MRSEKGDPNKCGHSWRRPKKSELGPREKYWHHVVCRLCDTMRQVPFDMIQHYDVYFPGPHEDEEDQ